MDVDNRTTEKIERLVMLYSVHEFRYDGSDEVATVKMTHTTNKPTPYYQEIAYEFDRGELEDLRDQIVDVLDSERPTKSISVVVELTVQAGFDDVASVVENELGTKLYDPTDIEAEVDSVYER